MKKLLEIIVLCLLLSENVQAQSLLSIQKYLKDNINFLDDPITLSYLMNRCSAVYLYGSVVTNQKEPVSAEKFANAASKVYQFSLQVLMNDLKYEYYKADLKTKQEIDTMFKYYKKDGDDFYARTGKYLMNTYIGEDIESCNVLYQAFKQ